MSNWSRHHPYHHVTGLQLPSFLPADVHLHPTEAAGNRRNGVEHFHNRKLGNRPLDGKSLLQRHPQHPMTYTKTLVTRWIHVESTTRTVRDHRLQSSRQSLAMRYQIRRHRVGDEEWRARISIPKKEKGEVLGYK